MNFESACVIHLADRLPFVYGKILILLQIALLCVPFYYNTKCFHLIIFIIIKRLDHSSQGGHNPIFLHKQIRNSMFRKLLKKAPEL